jgi:hypothetical protein
LPQGDENSKEGEREEEMRHDAVHGQLLEHHARAHEHLQAERDQEGDREAREARAVPGRTEDHDRDRKGGQADEPREDAVAVLDQHVGMRLRKELPLGERPVGDRETRSAQAHHAAPDHQGQREDDGEAEERAQAARPRMHPVRKSGRSATE